MGGRHAWGGRGTIGLLLIGLTYVVQLVKMDNSVSHILDIATLAAHQAIKWLGTGRVGIIALEFAQSISLGVIMADYDIVIRNGRIIDGTGAAGYDGDLAIKDGVIAAIGKIAGTGTEEIDAKGHLVTPGFVDIHTHYDGQAIWDSQLAPSSLHGVTTAVMGNCGVGFAPVRAGDHDKLIQLMEGVEDIPAPALHEGLDFNWESFGDYLDALDRRPCGDATAEKP